jgi:KDO2-lipid IV(A) lauroyltransferase
MSRKRSPVADYAVYLLVRFFVCLVQALPPTAAQGCAVVLAWVVYQVDRRHRAVALDNLRQAFPGQYSAIELDALVRAVFRHFCTLLVEIIQLPRRLNKFNWRNHIEIPDARLMVECLLSGRPLLLVTGHFGNWELGGYALGLLGFTTHAVARELDNPYLDQFLRQFRESTGQKILAKKGDFDEMLEILAGGGVLGTLGDQDAGQRGLFVEFFGRPASTHKAVAILALRHHVPLMVMGVRKVGEQLRYRVKVEDLILPEDYENDPDAIRAITQRFTTALERAVRAAPEQYFWLHRRWKHQPQARKSRRAAA